MSKSLLEAIADVLSAGSSDEVSIGTKNAKTLIKKYGFTPDEFDVPSKFKKKVEGKYEVSFGDFETFSHKTLENKAALTSPSDSDEILFVTWRDDVIDHEVILKSQDDVDKLERFLTRI